MKQSFTYIQVQFRCLVVTFSQDDNRKWPPTVAPHLPAGTKNDGFHLAFVNAFLRLLASHFVSDA